MRQVFTFDVECPASTPQSAPLEIATKVPAGEPVSVRIIIPDGHSGLTGIALAVAHQPCIPFNERLTVGESFDFIEGNDETPDWDLEGYPDSGAWSAFVYNTDTNPHKWQVRFVIGDVLLPGGVAAPAITPTLGVVAEPVGEGEAPVSAETPTELAPPAEPPPTSGTEPPPPEPPAVPTPVEPPAPPSEVPLPLPPAEPPEAPAPPSLPGAEAGEGPPPELGEGEPGEVEPRVRAQKPQRATGAPAVAQPRTRVVVSHESRPAGGWLPHGARFELKQTDQGQDFITNWRGKVIAPASGYVVHNLSDRPFPGGFGPRYPVVHIDSGAFAGDWYIGHTTSHVRDGERFAQGHELSTADQGYREGGGWVELGPAPGGYPGPLGSGAGVAHLFARPLLITRRATVTVSAPKRRVPALVRHPPGAGRGKPGARGGVRAPGAHLPQRPAPPPHREPSHHPPAAAHVAPAHRAEPPRPPPYRPPPRPPYHPPPPPPRPAPRPPPPRRPPARRR